MKKQNDEEKLKKNILQGFWSKLIKALMEHNRKNTGMDPEL